MLPGALFIQLPSHALLLTHINHLRYPLSPLPDSLLTTACLCPFQINEQKDALEQARLQLEEERRDKAQVAD